MSTVIVACVLYLYLSEDEGSFKTRAVDRFDEASEEESAVQREPNLNIFYLDLTFSNIPEIHFDEDDADTLLKALFKVSISFIEKRGVFDVFLFCNRIASVKMQMLSTNGLCLSANLSTPGRKVCNHVRPVVLLIPPRPPS